MVLVPEGKYSRYKVGKARQRAVTHWRMVQVHKQQGAEYWLFWGELVFTSSSSNYGPVFFGKLTFHPAPRLVWVDWLYHCCSDELINACISFIRTQWLLFRWALDPVRDIPMNIRGWRQVLFFFCWTCSWENVRPKVAAAILRIRNFCLTVELWKRKEEHKKTNKLVLFSSSEYW